MELYSDEYFMNEALKQAQMAFEEGEIPVGAVIVSKNRIIAKAYNQTERLNDVTAHAEMIAITSAANFLGGKYLNDCRLYVTLEPCTMCGGALFLVPNRRSFFLPLLILKGGFARITRRPFILKQKFMKDSWQFHLKN